MDVIYLTKRINKHRKMNMAPETVNVLELSESYEELPMLNKEVLLYGKLEKGAQVREGKRVRKEVNIILV